MPLLILLIALVQVACILHVYRTGRSYLWALVILSLPLLGSVLYTLLEMVPAARAAHEADRKDVPPAVDPRLRLQNRLAALEHCPSVANKTAAADAYMRCGRYAEAIGLYADALSGPHADDPSVLLGLARAQVNGGDCAGALPTLERRRTVDARFRPE